MSRILVTFKNQSTDLPLLRNELTVQQKSDLIKYFNVIEKFIATYCITFWEWAPIGSLPGSEIRYKRLHSGKYKKGPRVSQPASFEVWLSTHLVTCINFVS